MSQDNLINECVELFQKSVELIKNGNFNEALNFINRIECTDVSLPNLHYLKGFILYQLNRKKEALSTLNNELSIFPNNIEAYKLYLTILQNIDLQDFETLAFDLKIHITPEVYKPNDFYGNARALKTYANINENINIKASIDHGAGLGNGTSIWDEDIKAPFSHYLVSSEKVKQLCIKLNINKKISKIGPIVSYVKPILSSIEIEKEKQRLGKNALFFPQHSTHHCESNFDINETIKILRELSKEFNSVRVCLYWKDIVRGMGKYYQKAGFECVSNGHMFDPFFQNRHRTLISISDIVISNDLTGSCLANALALNKPIFVIPQNITYIKDEEEIHANKRALKANSEYEEYVKTIMHDAKELFTRELTFNISNHQREFAAYHFGTIETKSPQEMQDLILRCERDYLFNV